EHGNRLRASLMFRLKPIRYILENLVWFTATLLYVKFWALVYVDQCITVQNGISLGMYNVGRPKHVSQNSKYNANRGYHNTRHYYLSR
ncbi:MAG: hypothetical protein ACKPKO_43675, partial [Candidatus Fonsibacter sp.]